VADKPYKSGPYSHIFKIVVVLALVIGGAVVARGMFLPKDFGKHGLFRPQALVDEMNRPIRNWTNESCLQCHPYIKKAHLKGVHKTVSCEVCHGPYAAHIENDKVIGEMPVKRGEEIRKLCLRCHNKIIRARPKESIKTVAMPDHLKEKKVRTDHICNQCHMVHSPLLWVEQARAMMGLSKEKK